uniref:DUF659 domain-containing protein n=1 Tax=Cajanus cajan TaxID=3821 RepID=A0A151QNH1_CAJCA|nr:hypothetical protein KK1_047702 [Cajanus cajan]
MFTSEEWTSSQLAKTNDGKFMENLVADEKPAMGFICEENDRAKEKIQDAFKGDRPLHATGYYLNLILHYAPNFKVDWEVKKGFIDYMEKIVGDFEIIVDTKKRNCLLQKTMNDVVYVMENSKLNKKQVRKEKNYGIEDLSPDDGWIMEENEQIS